MKPKLPLSVRSSLNTAHLLSSTSGLSGSGSGTKPSSQSSQVMMAFSTWCLCVPAQDGHTIMPSGGSGGFSGPRMSERVRPSGRLSTMNVAAVLPLRHDCFTQP